MQEVRLFESILKPVPYFDSLNKAERLRGFTWRFLVLIGISIIVSAIASYFGFGTEEIMKNMDKASGERLEAAKIFFGIGNVVSGLLFPFFITIFFALYYWIFFEASFSQLFKLQMYPMFILVLEKVLNLPFFYFVGNHKELSPFGLGIVTQLLTDHPMLTTLISQFTIFQAWAAIIQIISLKKMSEKPLSTISLIVIGGHLIYILVVTIATLLIREVNIIL